MEQDKETEEVEKKSKNDDSRALARKDPTALDAKPQSPLMVVKEMPQKTKGEGGKEEEKPLGPEKEPAQESLKEQLEEKNRLVEEYYDRLLRTQAEFENYKKRTEKELNDFKIYANAQLIKDLLMIVDDFQTAMATKKNGSTSNFMKGMELIYENFYGMLEKEGLNIINETEENFDPWKHEAVEMVDTDEFPENTVIGVIQPGYKFRDKILRPAKVRVAVEPKKDDEVSEEKEEKDDSDEGDGKKNEMTNND